MTDQKLQEPIELTDAELDAVSAGIANVAANNLVKAYPYASGTTISGGEKR